MTPTPGDVKAKCPAKSTRFSSDLAKRHTGSIGITVVQEKSIGHVDTSIGGLKGWLTHGCCVSISKKRVEMMEKKAIKLLYGGHVPALPRSARDSKQPTTFMSPVF